MIPFILGVTYLINSRPEAVILAYSPGGINEMGLVAATLGIKPAFVITHHLFRLLIVVLILGLAQKFIYPKLKFLIQSSKWNFIILKYKVGYKPKSSLWR